MSGVLRNWSCPSSVHLHLPLWDLPQEWERAAWHCEEELWSPPWSHCQVMYNLNQTAPFNGSFKFCFTFQFITSLQFLMLFFFFFFFFDHMNERSFLFLFFFNVCFVLLFFVLPSNRHRHVSGIIESCSVSISVSMLSTHSPGLTG